MRAVLFPEPLELRTALSCRDGGSEHTELTHVGNLLLQQADDLALPSQHLDVEIDDGPAMTGVQGWCHWGSGLLKQQGEPKSCVCRVQPHTHSTIPVRKKRKTVFSSRYWGIQPNKAMLGLDSSSSSAQTFGVW